MVGRIQLDFAPFKHEVAHPVAQSLKVPTEHIRVESTQGGLAELVAKLPRRKPLNELHNPIVGQRRRAADERSDDVRLGPNESAMKIMARHRQVRITVSIISQIVTIGAFKVISLAVY
jgi:hypothetical protein